MKGVWRYFLPEKKVNRSNTVISFDKAIQNTTEQIFCVKQSFFKFLINYVVSVSFQEHKFKIGERHRYVKQPVPGGQI
jgi:hypothetical protein